MAVTRSNRPAEENAQPAATTDTVPKEGQLKKDDAENNAADETEKGEDAEEPALKKARVERLKYHLFKSEPESRMQDGHEMKFSIDDLMKEENGTAHWDGVRNHEAKNCMRRMKVEDLGFFYHSNTKKSKPGIVGIVEVVKAAYPDHTAFDEKDPHYDPKSNKDDPKWFMVDVKLVRRFAGCITLDDIKANPELAEMQLVKRGRISVQDVTDDEWKSVLNMAEGL